jgi:hypothetical protein
MGKVSVSNLTRLRQGQFGNCASKEDIYFGMAQIIPFFIHSFSLYLWQRLSLPFLSSPSISLLLLTSPNHQIFFPWINKLVMDYTSWFSSLPLSRTTRNFGRFHFFFSFSTTFMKLHVLMVRFHSMIFYDPLSLRKCVIGLISLFLLSSMKLGFDVGFDRRLCWKLELYMSWSRQDQGNNMNFGMR